MKSHWMTRVAVLALFTAIAGCGGGGAVPTAPTPPAPVEGGLTTTQGGDVNKAKGGSEPRKIGVAD